MFPDPSGTRLVFIDDKSDTFVYNPVSSTTSNVVTHIHLLTLVMNMNMYFLTHACMGGPVFE